ncbi:Response regulator receiver domain-containing protein [Butyrivibrio proteoclasticus]|uniref:Circadian input-output histidine kinase CikA n=1 Tax=Butyrivibrio proteoclasticus TaxID=43305 RepID=A0A1I5TVM5_9FIRM|nr:response regulator [Butyrivibrio proteoclasticus]SFP86366.1 Response regulator receiver domain-containing protein [Butyrivibrio proteoclasticus]
MVENKRKLNFHSFKLQLRLTFIVLIVIPVIFLGVYSYFIAKKNLIEQTKVAMHGSANVIAYGIENNAKRENDVIKFFSYEENFRSVLEHGKDDPFSLTEELTEKIEPLIWYYIGSDMSIESIHFYSDLIGQNHIGEFLSKPKDEMEERWYQLCRNDYGAQWVAEEDGGTYIIKALLDVSTSSKVIGIVVLKVNNEFFFSITKQSSYLNNGIIISDENGSIITEKEIADSNLNEQIKKTIFSGNIDGESESFITTDDYFLMASGKMSNGWRLFYYVDRSEIVVEVMSILSSVMLIAGVIFIIAFLIATIISNRMSSRVSKLNNAAHQIRNGNFDIEIHDDGKDEIADLSSSMENMAAKLKYMVDEINQRNQEDLLVKESDIHYREWLFDFVVEKNNDILAVVNEDDYSCNFLTSNAESILGISMEDMQKDIRVLTKAQREGSEERLKDIIEDCNNKGDARNIDEIRFENVKTGEHLYYRGVVICTIDDGGKRMAIALYDITQEIRRNHQLQEALNAAETANKAKTSFLANMSHDFRTPMNAITGFNLLIDKHAEEPDKVKEYTHKISLASQNLLSLLNDVLDMSKIESGKTTLDIKEVAIGLLLEEINSVISFQAKAKNQEYIVRIEEMEHDTFMGDKQRINEILMNILGNAIKYTPEGGKIEFLINESPSSSEGFQNVRFTIKDNGIGMKPEYKDKIFDAFTREDKGATKGIQGTGLGMAITKSLVELMGGTIRVESEEGKGSTFIVNLRLKAVDEKDVGFWKAHGISCAMLVAEKPESYEQIRTALEADDLEMMESKTGFEAIHAIENCNSAGKLIDLILIDNEVEAMSAAEIVKMVRSKDRRNNSLVLVMADSYEDVEDELKKAGANDILPKPVFISTLKQTVEDMTARASAKDTKEEKNPLEGMKFLAAEDNDINADILTELMSMEGATVTRGVNGQEVVEMFKEAKEGDYDMILMDIQMPVMNGYEAAAAIRAIPTDWAQRIPIIAMTANAYADDVQQAFDAGMNAHVSKPIDIKVVERTILEFKK